MFLLEIKFRLTAIKLKIFPLGLVSFVFKPPRKQIGLSLNSEGTVVNSQIQVMLSTSDISGQVAAACTRQCSVGRES